jgi:competence protein ComEC
MGRGRKPPQPFTLLAVLAAAGVAAADRWPFDWWIPVLGFGLLAGLFLWRDWTPVFYVAVVGGFFCLHTLNHHGDSAKRLAGQLSFQPRVVSAVGVVDSEPRAFADRRGRPFSRFIVRLESIRLNGHEQFSNALVNLSWPGPAPAYGDRVAFTGEATNRSPTRNPGQFDQSEYLRRVGMLSEIRVRYPSDTRLLGSGEGNALIATGMRVRRWMEDALTVGIEDAPLVSGLVRSMVLGMKSETPPEIRDLFRRTGTIHVFVVSGLHVGMVALIVWQFLRLFGVGRRTTAVVAVPFLVFYAILTGCSPGSVRATLMASLVLLGIAMERTPVTLNSLAAAFVLTLLWDTDQLFMPGFQFSFAVVLAIILFAGRLQRRFCPLGEPDPFLPRSLWTPWQRGRTAFLRYGFGLAAVSTSAWIGSLAFSAGFFNLLSPMALIANVFIVPLAFIILSQGALSVLAYTVSAGTAAIFNNCNWLAVHALVAIVEFFASLPGGHTYVELPMPGPRPQLEMTVLDLDSGGSIHVRSDGRDWLFDCGNPFAYRTIVRPYLQSRGVNRLEGFVVTHGDASHMGAAPEVLVDFRPRRVFLPELSSRSPSLKTFRRELQEGGPPNNIVRRGDRISLAPDSSARVLFPPPDLERRHSDDESMVLQFESGNWRILATGDSGFFTERWLMEQEDTLASDFLVAGRHRLDFYLTPNFLATVQSQATIISRTHYAERSRRIAESYGTVFEQKTVGAVSIRLWNESATLTTHLGHGETTFLPISDQTRRRRIGLGVSQRSPTE